MYYHVPIQHLIHNGLREVTFPIAIEFRYDIFNSKEKVTNLSLFVDVILITLLVGLGLFSCSESWTILYILEDSLNILMAVSLTNHFP